MAAVLSQRAVPAHGLHPPGAGTRPALVGVFGALALGSIGVYIGRFVRLNSWDVLLHPRDVVELVHVRLVAEPLGMAQALGALALTAFLGVAYLVVYSFANLRLELNRQEQAGESRDAAGF